MLVLVDDDGPSLAARHRHRRDFLGEIAGRDRSACALLRADRHRILVGARHLEFLGDVLAGLRHRIDAVLRLHQRIDEAPANGGVVNLGRARERFRRLAHHEGRAGHGFDAAGNREIDFAGADRAARGADRIEARRTETIQGLAGNRFRHAREQQRHPRHVTVVLAGLVGAAEKHLIHLRPVEIGMLRHQRLDRGRGQIVGAYLGERAAETADRGPDGIANEYITHRISP